MPPQKRRRVDITDASGLDKAGCASAALEALADPELEELSIDRRGIGPDACCALAAALALHPSVTRVSMVRNGAGARGGRALAAAIATNETLRTFDMSLNDVGSDAARALGAALGRNGALTSLKMARCGLGPAGGKALAAALLANSTLATLDVEGNDLGMEGGKALASALRGNRTLTALNLDWNRIGFGDVGGAALLEALETSRVKRLSLVMNELGGCYGALRNLGRNASLTSLNLSRNELGPGAGDVVARALKWKTLRHLDVSANDLGAGSAAIGYGLAENESLTHLDMSRNGVESPLFGEALEVNATLRSLAIRENDLGDAGGAALARGLARNRTLETLDASRNGLSRGVGDALASAIAARASSLTRLDLSSNELGDSAEALVRACSGHGALAAANFADNGVLEISLESQLALAGNGRLRVDLSANALSSPPLGGAATPERLRDYVSLLAAEASAVSRVRVMVLGFGGVGKTTFCAAATSGALAAFGDQLAPVERWDVARVKKWARNLGTRFDEAAAAMLERGGVAGVDLPALVSEAGALEALAGGALEPSELRRLKVAVGSLLAKRYHSTVGVQAAGRLDLGGGRSGSLVDFAGQMEYLVSHQLLLASMHTLCVVIQPAPSFAKPTHRHHGSWRYWLAFLRCLGERRTASLILAASRLDDPDAADGEAAMAREYASLGLGGDGPLRLDYDEAERSVERARARLSSAADAVSEDWFVPRCYDSLSKLVGEIAASRKARRELPLLSRTELEREISRRPDLARLGDAQLLERAVEYLEAVGDVMSDGRLDVLLLDPVDWFAKFLAYFIRDDGNPPAEVRRGVVLEADVVAALRHEYAEPERQVREVMALVCRLELCVPHGDDAYMFPCLLPAAGPAPRWPGPGARVFRGHRFRFDFLPPGLFPGFLAKLRLLPPGASRAEDLWSDAAVLAFGAATVLVRRRPESVDVLAAAPEAARLFVGAAKGQASVVVWLAHVFRAFVRTSYARLAIDEAWLCGGCLANGEDAGEFPLDVARPRSPHDCAACGCFYQLGTGHAREAARLRDGDERRCPRCGDDLVVRLRN